MINLLRDRLLAYDILQMDETPVQVLKEPGRAAQSKSYLWLQRGGPPEQPVVLYDYDPGRGAVTEPRGTAARQPQHGSVQDRLSKLVVCFALTFNEIFCVN